MYTDIELTCEDCGLGFVFTAGEQEFFNERGLTSTLRRCRNCRIARTKLRNSIKLEAFVNEIQYINRNPIDSSVLEILKQIETNPIIIANPGEYFYRARILTDIEKANKENPFWGYSKKDSFVPPSSMTKDMRANYKYIPYLYCSNSPYISLCEVRPRFGAIVSIAKIIVNERMEIFDLTLLDKPKRMSSEKINLCDNLSDMFSKPITHDEDVLNYIPTQYIAEFIKNLGYSGIKYKSSYELFPGEADESNFVIFNYSRCEPIKSNIFRINKSILGYEKDDEDVENIFDF